MCNQHSSTPIFGSVLVNQDVGVKFVFCQDQISGSILFDQSLIELRPL